MSLGHEKLDVYQQERKIHLDRIAAILSKLGGRGYCVQEEEAVYGARVVDWRMSLTLGTIAIWILIPDRFALLHRSSIL